MPGNQELQDLKMERCTYIYNVSLRILHEYMCKSTEDFTWIYVCKSNVYDDHSTKDGKGEMQVYFC